MRMRMFAMNVEIMILCVMIDGMSMCFFVCVGLRIMIMNE